MIHAELVTHMGDDLFVANSLRRSFGVGYDTWSETPRTPRGRSDRQLIEDCARDGHLLPFRHPHITFSCTAPIVVARQLGKHQVGMDWSEVSRRYKTTGITCHDLYGTWRADVKDRRQGSGEELPPDIQTKLAAIQWENIRRCVEDYDDALRAGASPEQARFLLPQAMDVAWVWTGSLLSWAHMYKQRHHKDAQAETREFADQVGKIIEPLFPVSWGALVNPV